MKFRATVSFIPLTFNLLTSLVPFGKRPKTLPIVLSRNEIDKLLQCTPNLKHRTFLMTLYSAGLRFSEAAHLRIADIDSDRMMIRVARGKAMKERLVPLSPRLLKELRVYWLKYKPGDLLFPGKSATKTYADTSIQKAMKRAAEKAGIKKRVYPHVLRHSYADRTSRGGSGLVDDQQTARAREFRHDDDLPALPKGTSSQCPQSTGLAASETTADVPTAPGKQRSSGKRGPEEQPKLSLTEILRLGAAGAVDDSTCHQVPKRVGKDLSVPHARDGRTQVSMS